MHLTRPALAVVAVLGALTSCSSSHPADGTAPTRTQLRALLSTQSAAVREHDRARFAAGLDTAPAAQAFRAAQLDAFDNLTQVPLSTWSYELGPRGGDAGAQAAARARYGPSAVVVRVSLSYALRGVDAAPTEHDLYWTFVRRDGHVRIAADDGMARAGGASWHGPWDYGPLTVVRGRHCLVIGHPDTVAVLHAVADAVDRAVPAVTAVWGAGWQRYVGVVVPSTPDELSADLGATASVTAPVAALAADDGQDPVSGRVLGQRLVVEPDVVRRLSATGLRIVVTHEVTHIADAATTSNAVPRWLVEGFAEYVGNLHSGQSVPVAAAELGRDVRAGRLPAALPTDAAFDAKATSAQAYQEAWLACRLVARLAGQAGLVRLYRLVGASGEPADRAVATALHAVVGESVSTFQARWRAELRSELG